MANSKKRRKKTLIFGIIGLVFAGLTTAAIVKKRDVIITVQTEKAERRNLTEIVIANLFLHHFEDARLAEVLDQISRRAKLFIAVEPHRFCCAPAGAQLLRFIGGVGLYLLHRFGPPRMAVAELGHANPPRRWRRMLKKERRNELVVNDNVRLP